MPSRAITKIPTDFDGEKTIMSIEKKSLISTLKTTKKANIAGAPVVDSGAKKETDLKMRYNVSLRANVRSLRAETFKSTKLSTTKSTKSVG
jgi:hypothetical protein